MGREAISAVSQLVFISVIGAASLACVALYLGCPIDWVLLTTFAGFEFSIYGINRFTDKEDTINAPDAHLFFNGNTFFLAIVIGVFATSFFALLSTGKLTVFHILLVVFGLFYSLRLVPTNIRNGRWAFSRLKDIPFAKSITVSALLGTAFFVINLSIYPMISVGTTELVLLMSTCVLMIFMNTNFFDIRDVNGDSVMNIPTIPVLFGVRKTILFTTVIPAALLLLATVVAMISGAVSWAVTAVVALNCLYPVVYHLLWRYGRRHAVWASAVADFCVVPYACGLLALHFFN